ncbi:hypothetical protein SYK_10950 [Pseudodesulfovibrio nedwellii]|uniref:Uncharacterized protein n=1 Tax=Pseudodesulfovibrio nedwellii TaxID=2973072 RepID=A0ABM8AYX8_9BACT|nr:hypothetical protein SYK_10950 [Pseudodesulfovibrio nedwellii]
MIERAFEWKPDTRQQPIPLLPFGSDGVLSATAIRLPSFGKRILTAFLLVRQLFTAIFSSYSYIFQLDWLFVATRFTSL